MPRDAPGLMTIGDYLGAIGWKGSPDNGGHGWGYGYRADLSGAVFTYWRRYDAEGRCVASSNFYTGEPGFVRSDEPYAVVPAGDRYRWRRLDCQLCRRPYAGWYVLQPYQMNEVSGWGTERGPILYELYDTSYWHSFNDEPCDEDRAGVVDITPEMVAEALREFLAKRGAR